MDSDSACLRSPGYLPLTRPFRNVVLEKLFSGNSASAVGRKGHSMVVCGCLGPCSSSKRTVRRHFARINRGLIDHAFSIRHLAYRVKKALLRKAVRHASLHQNSAFVHGHPERTVFPPGQNRAKPLQSSAGAFGDLSVVLEGVRQPASTFDPTMIPVLDTVMRLPHPLLFADSRSGRFGASRKRIGNLEERVMPPVLNTLLSMSRSCADAQCVNHHHAVCPPHAYSPQRYRRTRLVAHVPIAEHLPA